MTGHEAYLRNALSKYKYPDIAKSDILNAFRTFTDLRPNLDTFVFNDGSPREMVCMDGTIPVQYKGSTYNIPICLWLMDTHPYNPPMAFVKPTSNMQVKPGRHVDANGRVYLPYLHEWKHPQSDLLGLIQIMTIIFGEEPPVFSKSASSQAAQRPYPAQQPYPAGGGMPMPYAGGPGGYPPPTSQYPVASGYPNYPNYSSAASQSYGTGYPAYSQANTGASTNSMSLSDDQIKASLVSAVEDKMRRRLKEIFAQAQAESSALRKTQEDLTRGKQTLDDMLQKLEKEQNDVERNITLLQEKNEEIEGVLGKMENREEVEIDDAIDASAPLYRQLLVSFAEEQATADAIYYLADGLKRGAIDLDGYLKQVRELSRRQFMMRALIQKCRQKAGLPEVTSD